MKVVLMAELLCWIAFLFCNMPFETMHMYQNVPLKSKIPGKKTQDLITCRCLKHADDDDDNHCVQVAQVKLNVLKSLSI